MKKYLTGAFVAVIILLSGLQPLFAQNEEGIEASEDQIVETGIASWYGPGFHESRTAMGEMFDMEDLTAAHPSLPFDTLVLVTNLRNSKSVIVRINDRGPFIKNRIIDLSKEAANRLDMLRSGVARVRVEVIQN